MIPLSEYLEHHGQSAVAALPDEVFFSWSGIMYILTNENNINDED